MNSKVDTIKKLVGNYAINKGIFKKNGNGKIAILMYHGIDIDQNTKYNQRFFSKDTFEAHISALKKHTNILTHEDFLANRISETKLNTVITFDDGYLNNLKYAVPVLEKYNAHAYFFITGVATVTPSILWADAVDIVSKHAAEGKTITIDDREFVLKQGGFLMPGSGLNIKAYIKQSAVPGYEQKAQLIDQLLRLYDIQKYTELADLWQLMDDEQIKTVAKSKCITVGSHGYYHHNLGSLGHEDAVAEILRSKRYLESLTQKEVSTIGYPDGSYTVPLNEAVALAGFNKQFLVEYAYNDNGKIAGAHDRIGLYPYMGTPNQILYRITR